MLIIETPQVELYDETSQEFVYIDSQKIELEHSLVSISKWESISKKPFLSKNEKTNDETLSYIECMSSTKIEPLTLKYLTIDNLKKIQDYIADDHTATKINVPKNGKNNDIVTSELIYYWMIALNIPFECQYWHLNRLLTLINITNIKNSPPKKMSKQEMMSRNAALNAQRRQQMKSKG